MSDLDESAFEDDFDSEPIPVPGSYAKLLPSPENKRFLIETAQKLTSSYLEKEPSDSWKRSGELCVSMYSLLVRHLMSDKF